MIGPVLGTGTRFYRVLSRYQYCLSAHWYPIGIMRQQTQTFNPRNLSSTHGYVTAVSHAY